MTAPSLLRLSLLSLLMLCFPVSYALADGPGIDCENAMTQRDMNYCAAGEALRAEEELNAAYEAAMIFAKDTDKGVASTRRADTFIKAQSAWVTYRDMSCDAEAALYDGGSIQPMIYSSCLERLNLNRSEELKAIYQSL